MAQIVRYPDSPFILHQPFPPAGDQPSAIEALSEGLEDGVMFQTLLGVTGSGKTYTMANVIARLGVPALIMAPNKTLAAQTYAEMRDFFPENAVEYFVSYYDYYQPEAYIPHTDTFIEKDAAINAEIERLRHSATAALFAASARRNPSVWAGRCSSPTPASARPSPAAASIWTQPVWACR